MKSELKDEELIRIYLNTQQNDCFETLYNRYVTKVYRRCLSLTKDSAKAEDFTHDIFLRVFSNLPNFKERSAFSTWLYSISYNYCMDQLRVSNRTSMLDLDEDMECSIDPEEVEATEIKIQHLVKVLNRIDPDELQLLRLKYEEGMDVREIGQKLQLGESAVKMRLKRTRDKVRRLYLNSPV